MSYSNKLIKYIKKINFLGGASSSDSDKLIEAELSEYGGGGGGEYINGYTKQGNQLSGQPARQIIYINGKWYVHNAAAIIKLAQSSSKPIPPVNTGPDVLDHIFEDLTPRAVVKKPREYVFKRQNNDDINSALIGFEEWEKDTMEQLKLLKGDPTNEINFDGVKQNNRQEFTNMMRVLMIFYPRLNEIWDSLHETVLVDSERYYYEYFEYDRSVKYGLAILKSIYDQVKKEQKFKDGADICMWGYSPHSKRQCKNFNGESHSDLLGLDMHAPELLHWPDQLCPRDADPARALAEILKDTQGRPLKANGTVAKKFSEYVTLVPANPGGGCGLHRDRHCSYLHKLTVLQCPGPTKGTKVDCRQIEFQLVGHERNVPPVVFFKGFPTLPENGKWFKNKPFAEPHAKSDDLAGLCKFRVGDFVKLKLDTSTVRSDPTLSLPTYERKWVSQVLKLNFNASNDCVSVRVKIGSIFSDEFEKAVEQQGAPAMNDVDVTSELLRSAGLTSMVYFRTIAVKLLELTDPPPPAPLALSEAELSALRLAFPPSAPVDEDAPEVLTEISAARKIDITLKTLRGLDTEFKRELDLFNCSETLESIINMLKDKLKPIAKLSEVERNRDDIRQIINRIKKNMTELEAVLTEVKKRFDPFQGNLKSFTMYVAELSEEFRDALALSKIRMWSQMNTPNLGKAKSKLQLALGNVPPMIKRIKDLRIKHDETIKNLVQSIKADITTISIIFILNIELG